MDPPSREIGILTKIFTGFSLFFLLGLIFTGLALYPQNWQPQVVFISLAILVILNPIIIHKRKLSNYYNFFDKLNFAKEITRMVNNSTDTSHRINVKEFCIRLGRTLNDFKEGLYFFENEEFNNSGDFDYESGIYYSRLIKPDKLRIVPEKIEDLCKRISSGAALNISQMAGVMGIPFENLRFFLYNYCGTKQIHGKTQWTPNGDYIVIPEVSSSEDFIVDLNKFVAATILAEKNGVGKKAGGKSF